MTSRGWGALATFAQEERARAYAASVVVADASLPRLDSQYCPHKPHPAQERFLALDCREALYGGAAGGGKSDALLMAALQYVHVPGYAALILRRTYADLALPGAIMDRSQEWMRGSDARWNEQKKRWTFPSGATITFGYLEQDKDKFRYQGAEFQYCGFDELTQFDEPQYRYLLSRLRRTESMAGVPLRMRAASNPGGVGHQWVMERFPIPERGGVIQPVYEDVDTGRVFVPAKLHDNPSLDEASYRANLADLDESTRKQLEDGDWHAVRGRFFSMWNRDKHVCPAFDIPPHWRLYGGLDWGYGAPSAFCLGAFDEQGYCYIIGEIYLRESDDDDTAASIAGMIQGHGRSIKDVPIAADPSMWVNLHVRKAAVRNARGERRIDAYLEAGLRVHAADNSRVDGWANVRRYLNRQQIQLFDGKAKDLERTLPMLDPDKNNPDDVDTKQEDHAADALRYLLQQRPLNAPNPEDEAVKKEEAEIRKRLREAGSLVEIGVKKSGGFFG